MDDDARRFVIQNALKRLTDMLACCAFALAAMQAGAYLVAWYSEWCHPPAGRFVDVDGTKLHYLVKGTGQPVIFIHGNEGIAQDFDLGLMDACAKNYLAVSFDRPGHGYSQRQGEQIFTLQVQAQYIHRAVERLGLNKPILVGHSWGGALALSYALAYPNDVQGLVLLAPVAYSTRETAGHMQEVMEYIPVVGDLLISAYVVTARPWLESSELQVFYPELPPAKYIDYYCAMALRPTQIKAYVQDEITLDDSLRAISKLYHEITVPVTIVSGELDTQVPPSLHAERLHKEIVQSKLVYISGAGHQIELRRYEQIVGAIDIISRL